MRTDGEKIPSPQAGLTRHSLGAGAISWHTTFVY